MTFRKFVSVFPHLWDGEKGGEDPGDGEHGFDPPRSIHHFEWMENGEESVETDADEDHGGEVETKSSSKLANLTEHITPVPLEGEAPEDFGGDHSESHDEVSDGEMDDEDRDPPLEFPQLSTDREEDGEIARGSEEKKERVGNHNVPLSLTNFPEMEGEEGGGNISSPSS